MGLGSGGCPTAADDRRAAVVNTEHPLFVTIGFLLTIFGFVIQFLAVPEPTSIAQLRREIKIMRMKDDAMKARSN